MVPLTGFLCLYWLGRQDVMTDRIVLARRLSHLAVAAPPAFTLTGVLLHLMKIADSDTAVWTCVWIAVLLFSAMLVHTAIRRPAALSNPAVYTKLRVAHGIASLAILLVFLAPHLFNHLFGMFGDNTHLEIEKALRVVYRQHLVEPVLIFAFFFQILSGLVLAKPKTERRADFLDALQTASGAYLTFFIASHINSVFILGRYFGSDTTYAWAVNDPVGLVQSPWAIRLLPHYSLAVFLVIAHLACGMRVVLRNHGMKESRSSGMTWFVIAIGALATIEMTAGMLGFRLK
jgi:succinate dehydrogenase/fumarate reductase cytochrome b subunit